MNTVKEFLDARDKAKYLEITTIPICRYLEVIEDGKWYTELQARVRETMRRVEDRGRRRLCSKLSTVIAKPTKMIRAHRSRRQQTRPTKR